LPAVATLSSTSAANFLSPYKDYDTDEEVDDTNNVIITPAKTKSKRKQKGSLKDAKFYTEGNVTGILICG